MSTKVRTSIWSAQTLTAGAGNTTSATQSLAATDGTTVDFLITNGATGPTIAAQVQIQVANDSGGTLWVNFGGPIIGSVTNSAVTHGTAYLDHPYAAMRLVAGSNTGQNVTVDADISSVTVIS
jgi:hypothetical protein